MQQRDRGRVEIRAADRGGRPWIGSSTCCRSCGRRHSRRSTSLSLALVFGGLAGLLLGLALYATRPGSLFPQRAVFGILNVVVNFFRPIPFVILLAAVQPHRPQRRHPRDRPGIRHLRHHARLDVRDQQHRGAESADGAARDHRSRSRGGREPLAHPVPAHPPRGARAAHPRVHVHRRRARGHDGDRGGCRQPAASASSRSSTGSSSSTPR